MYKLSDTRVLETRNESGDTVVVIRDTANGKFIEIPSVRWASFLLMQNDIDNAVKRLVAKEDYVNDQEHIGGGWYVSVTTGYWCVDIRRFYYTKNGEIKPSKNGLALRLSEWSALLNQLPMIMSFEPELLVACPCSMREDHLNDPRVLLGCRECTPFGDIV